MRKSVLCSSLVICSLVLFVSCTTYKNVPYFQDFSETDTSKPTFFKSVPFKSPTIAPDDILVITIENDDNAVKELLNTSSSEAVLPEKVVPNGYVVDKDGCVRLRFLGKIKVAGLTTSEASNLIENEANKQFNNAVVNVRFGNFKITILGEVANPSTFVMSNEKVNIFDALGKAGDLTIYGKRQNVLLLRDSNSVEGKNAIRINLNSKNIVSSPYFFLKPNDIIYIPPNKDKFIQSNATLTRDISIAASIISVLALVLYRF